MHFEFLVEDASGKKFLEIIVPKIIGDNHDFRIISYKGLGDLLKNLPKLLKAYGKTWQYGYQGVVIVVCDLDNKCLKQFRQELFDVLHQCQPQPNTCFCIAIEEGEAWLLGDIPAIKKAFPEAKNAVLHSYKNDAICGTWEKLADALYKGGAESLKRQNPGAEKCRWAETITPLMNIEQNQSPSFQYFRKQLKHFSTM